MLPGLFIIYSAPNCGVHMEDTDFIFTRKIGKRKKDRNIHHKRNDDNFHLELSEELVH